MSSNSKSDYSYLGYAIKSLIPVNIQFILVCWKEIFPKTCCTFCTTHEQPYAETYFCCFCEEVRALLIL